MEVVLLILKIIGIVLLSIIGFVLLLMLLMLFLPLSYGLKANKEGQEYKASLSVGWLFRFVTAALQYQDEAWLRIKVFGIPVYKLKLWPADEKEEAETALEEGAGAEEALAENFETTSQQEDTDFLDEDSEEGDMLSDEAINREIEEQWQDDTPEDAFEQLTLFQKIKAFIQKIKEFILKCYKKCYNIKDSINETIEKVKKRYKEIQYYIKLVQHPCIQPALQKLWKSAGKMLRHIRPRRIRAVVEYGSGDPASTMKVYGYYCMIYPFYGKQIQFTPDMENKVLNLDGKMTGHIQMIRILFMGWKLFTDRNIRKLIRLIRREVKRRGRK